MSLLPIPVVQSFTVNPAAQTIAFGALSNVVFGATPFALTATASSGRAVIFAPVTTPVCTVSGVTLAVIAAGTCSITASQPGNANYVAATPVSNSLTINPAAQTVSFGSPGNVSFGAAPFSGGHISVDGLQYTQRGFPVDSQQFGPRVC